MKTIQNIKTAKIKRVSELIAIQSVNEGNWKYISKSLWKEQVRDLNEITIQEVKGKKINKMSKAQKRHQRRKK